MTDIQIRNIDHMFEDKPEIQYNHVSSYKKKDNKIGTTQQRKIYIPTKKIPTQEFKDLLREDWATGKYDNKTLTIMYKINYQMLYKLIPQAKLVKKIITDEIIESIKAEYKTGKYTINYLMKKYNISYLKIKPYLIDVIIDE